MKEEKAATCHRCPTTVWACETDRPEAGPGFCPYKTSRETIEKAVARYESDPELLRLARESARVEARGYCRWTRLEETIHLARAMGWKKLGIASCIGLMRESAILASILEGQGFEVVSASCKTGSVPKERLGLLQEEKVTPGKHESICNSIAQAELLNESGTEFNILVGLCVGHDSVFLKFSKAFVTVFAAKDRVLCHNPLGAVYLSESYYSRVKEPLTE